MICDLKSWRWEDLFFLALSSTSLLCFCPSYPVVDRLRWVCPSEGDVVLRVICVSVGQEQHRARQLSVSDDTVCLFQEPPSYFPDRNSFFFCLAQKTTQTF